ncbi:MAG: T9SS type A sorting domain-containing protein [Bacteroidales bacterium]|nr:T9SS type A sorting domain-containing protein [Bacteroidales bacterium]
MKKLLLTFLAVGIGFYSIGQSVMREKAVNNNNSPIANKGMRYEVPKGDQSISSGPVLSSNETTRSRALGPEIVIGKTKYDLQTNNTMVKRLLLLASGKMIATWTFANSGTPWNDRGTGYNYFNGTAWTPYPVGTPCASMLRLETLKTGWPSPVATNNNGSEFTIAHNFGAGNVQKMSRATIGTGNWTENAMTALNLCWPRMATSGSSNNTVHLFGKIMPDLTKKAGVIDALVYYRSTDGGATWGPQTTLPGFDSTICKITTSEWYAMDANNNTVAIVLGGQFNSVYLFKSTDNGIGWTRKLIHAFPGAPFNPDSVATPATDTIPCFDGAYSVVVDNSGKVHVWGGVTKYNQTALGMANTFYWPQQCGLIYWRDDMPTITGDLSLCSNFCWPWNYYVERNGNGIWDVFHTGWINMGFNVGGTSMPGGSIDANGNLYVVFQHMSDADPSTFHIYGTDTVPYRHLFAISSTDGGTTWSDAFEMTPFDEGRDYVFPAVAKNSTDSIRMIYQEDDLPGTSLNPTTGNPHPSGYECDIVYLSSTLIASITEKNKLNINISLYPNPANEYTNVNFSLSRAGTVNISVINVMGQKVASYKVDGISGKNYKQINTENLATGMYVIKIEAEGKLFTEKLIKN